MSRTRCSIGRLSWRSRHLRRCDRAAAAVSLYVTHGCTTTPCEPRQRSPWASLIAFGRLATLPVEPETTVPDRRRRFRGIEGGGSKTVAPTPPYPVLGYGRTTTLWPALALAPAQHPRLTLL